MPDGGLVTGNGGRFPGLLKSADDDLCGGITLSRSTSDGATAVSDLPDRSAPVSTPPLRLLSFGIPPAKSPPT